MADTIQRDILTIYLEPNKPIRGPVARMDTLKLIITVKDTEMKSLDLSNSRLILTATDSEKTVFWDIYSVNAANGVVAAEVQPDVVGRNEYRLKVILSDTSEVTFFVGALAVAVENSEHGPVATIDSMTGRMLDAMSQIDFNALAAKAFPVGTVMGFAMTSIPDSFLIANGADLNPLVYVDLVAVLGKTKLPDYRGKFLRGFDFGAGVDKGRVFGTTQQDALQDITGSFAVLGMGLDSYVNLDLKGAFYPTTHTDVFGVVITDSNFALRNMRQVNFSPSRVARTATETRPVNDTVVWCIKY